MTVKLVKKGLKLVYVDGYKIRQNLDPHFSVIHFNGNPAFFDSKWYIPEGEIWFDCRFRGEEDFLKKILLSISSRSEAKKFIKKGKPKNFIIKEEKRGGLKIQYIDGRVVREYLDPEFVMGGHDLVYSYIPKKTVWLDNRMDPRDIPHTLLHETAERKLMAEGKNYDIAHDYATAAEKESRRMAGGIYIGDCNHSGKFSIKDYYAK
jgi:hypothetical protein